MKKAFNIISKTVILAGFAALFSLLGKTEVKAYGRPTIITSPSEVSTSYVNVEDYGSDRYHYSINADFVTVNSVNYAFDHWGVEGGNIDIRDQDADVEVTSNSCRVTAYYVRLYSFTLSGDAHVTSVTKNTSDTLPAGGYVTIDATGFEEGYEFDHWESDNGGSFESASSASTRFTMPEGDVTVTAKSKAKTIYNIYVSGDEHVTASADPNPAYAGQTVTLTAEITNAAYEFYDWVIGSNSTDVNLANHDSSTTTFTMPAHAVTITCNSRLKPTYNITVTKDGGGANSTCTVPSSGYQGQRINLQASAGDGYVFDKWTCESNNITLYNSTSPTEAYFSMPGAAVNLTAHFKKNFKVTFKVKNGKWNDQSTADQTVTLTGLPTATLKLSASHIPGVGEKPNEHYKTGSWDVAPNTTREITGNTTYTYTYAPQERINHIVTFKVKNGSWNDGTTNDKTVTLSKDENEDLALKLVAGDIPAAGNKPASGYKAGEWDTVPSTETVITENKTYTYTYARIPAPSEYTVTVHNDGHGTGKAEPASGVEGTSVTISATPSDDDYRFKEWQVIEGGITLADKTKAQTTFSIKKTNVVVKAIFEKKENPTETCTISFDKNGGSGSMNDQTVTKGTATALKKNTFTRSGYTFKNWNTKSDGSGISYADQGKVQTQTNVTLYAQWKKSTPKHKSDDDSSDNDNESSSSNNNNNTKAPDGCDELRLSLSSAIATLSVTGKPQTVYWNKGTSLPYDVMKMLHDNPLVTLVFSYTYMGQSYTVTIPGSLAIANPSIQWYGPVYLYALYGQNQKVTLPAQTSAATGTYTIESGDTLSGIAKRLNTTLKHLKDANNIKDADKIKPGMVLKY